MPSCICQKASANEILPFLEFKICFSVSFIENFDGMTICFNNDVVFVDFLCGGTVDKVGGFCLHLTSLTY